MEKEITELRETNLKDISSNLKKRPSLSGIEEKAEEYDLDETAIFKITNM